MTDLSFRQANPGNEVSVKTGMAQLSKTGPTTSTARTDPGCRSRPTRQ